MGQTIEITQTAVVETVLLIDTDRSLTGQEGCGFDGADAARDAAEFPAVLAVRLFEADPGIDHVFVMSNTVTVRRPQGWEDDAVARAAGIVSDFFRFYR